MEDSSESEEELVVPPRAPSVTLGDADELLAAFARRDMPPNVDGVLVQRLMDHLVARWLDPPLSDATVYYEWVCERIGLDPHASHMPSDVDRRFSEAICALSVLYMQMEQVYHPDDPQGMLTMVDDGGAPGVERRRDMGRIAQAMHFGRRLLLDWTAVAASADRSVAMSWEERARTLIDDDDKLNDHQIVLLRVLEQFGAYNYRRYGESYYEEIVADGERTGAWRCRGRVLNFIYECAEKHLNYSLWVRLTSQLNHAEHVCSHLQKGNDRDFPELRYNHRLFSFRNGIFDVRSVTFFPFALRSQWEAMAARSTRRLHRLGDEYEAHPPSRDEASIKYFDQEFRLAELEFDEESGDLFELDPASIACPALLRVLESQRMDPETIYWLFAFLGRMFFKVGELDNWQVLVFLKGVAGSGKSTIAALMKSIYTPEMVGVLSSNAEGKFGLSPLYKTHLVICPEAKRNFAISQGDLQSMISGEDVSVAIKHREAETVTWTANLLFCGNELPNWADASGSMSRRLLMFLFDHKVTEVDPSLPEQMTSQVDCFLLRAALSYHKAVLAYAGCSIWSKVDGKPILSEQLHEFHESMVMLVHPLMNYLLSSGEVELTHRNPELDAQQTYMPEEDFIVRFQTWCKNRVGYKPVWDKDYYGSTFEEYGLSVREETRVYEGMEAKMRYIFGLRPSPRPDEAY